MEYAYFNDYLISLTPEDNNELNSPLILTLNKTSLEITNTCTISIDESILNSLFNLSIVESAGTNENEIYLVLTFDKTIYFFGTVINKVTAEQNITIDTTKSSLSENLESTSQNVELADINQIIVNNKLMFLITTLSEDTLNP